MSAPDASRSPARWWQTAVLYQIYPRSFMDANGDGVGDLPGILRRLDYLPWLGVDVIWISPFFPSPMADFGYDITDHKGVDPLFGTLADFDRLLAAAHAKGLRLIIDFVPNHTSALHPWFLESRGSRASRKRDWYIWRDPGPGGGPPNNWLSVFGGSAWEYDAHTEQYYYHAFLKEQPDLNWRNPAVREAMLDVMRFWLKRGVDGFRIDALWHLAKDAALRDEPPNPIWRPGMDPYERLDHIYSCDQPEIHGLVRAMRQALAEWPDCVLIGELYLPVERLAAYYGAPGQGIDLPFNFHLLSTPWRAEAVAGLIERYERALPEGAWPNWVLGNHDRPRIASRVGLAQAPVAAMLLFTLRGTPTLYYGDELGLANVPIPPERALDPWERRVPGLGLGRDPVRTPMPWDGSDGAGFTAGTPWLPLNDDYATRNVAALAVDPASLLTLYRALIALRRTHPALREGAIARVRAEDGVLTYRRETGAERILVCLNFGDAPRTVSLECDGRALLSTAMARHGTMAAGPLSLAANEGLILALEPGP